MKSASGIDLSWIDDLRPNLTIDEVIEQTGIIGSRSTAYRMIRDGRLRALRITQGGSSRVLIPRGEVRRLIEEAVEAAP